MASQCTRWARRYVPLALVLAGVLATAAAAGAAAKRSQPITRSHRAAVKPASDPPAATAHDVSAPLRDIAPAVRPGGKEKKEKKQRGLPAPPASSTPDPVVQTAAGSDAAPALGIGFEGIGTGFTGPQGTFEPDSAPPDTNGAVGPSNYVQIVNESFAVFNKSGTPLYGPAPTNTLWSGFGGGCQSNDDGDATVVYDRAANRWIFTQFSVATTPYLECVAVSTTGDPTGSYYRYSFQYANFPDYPKLGVWPDAYYITFNMFNGSSGAFLGPEMCAYDRAKMLSGLAATQKCFTLGTNDLGLLPSTVDSATPPPAGSPDYMVEFATGELLLYKFHVNWTTPSSSTFTGPTHLPVAAFSAACGGATCIPQPGTTQKLDSLADRLMYRFAYRKFSDHESLVIDHAVTAGTSVGMRWYELRDPNGTPTVYQQGTYAPDASYRWMGSAAMDGAGDVAMGFSVASKSVFPSIHYTAHLVTDPLGVMGQGEGVLMNGAGSQNGSLSRWGDYSSLNIDPSDDCTFWYTNEYLAQTGSFNWHTRIGSFALPGCAPDFSLSATPASRSIVPGGSTSYTVSVTPNGAFAGSVGLSVAGLPVGATPAFDANPTASSSTLSITTTLATPPGSYPLTITGTSGSLTHTASATLVVLPPDFALSATPSTSTVNPGGPASYAVSVTPSGGFGGSVAFSVTGLPAGATGTFSPLSSTAGSTLSVTTTGATPIGSYPLTITGKSGVLTHTASATLVVTPAPDFTLQATPGSRTVLRGDSTSFALTLTSIGGFSSPVSLSVSGLPANSTATFAPNPATGLSTLTISVLSQLQIGARTLTITGKGGGLQHSIEVTLILQ